MSESIRVFVCGTYDDLREEREVVHRVLAHLNLSCLSMEYFGAKSAPPIETCLSNLREAELVLVLAGHRYGSCPHGDNLSYVEKEYREARAKDIPVLSYIRSDEVRIPPRFVEQERPVKLEEFKEQLGESTVAYYHDPVELGIRVAVDVFKFLADRQGEEEPEEKRSGEWDFEFNRGKRVALVSGLYGKPWPNLENTLKQAGFEVRTSESVSDFTEKISDVGLVVIPGSGYKMSGGMSPSIVGCIEHFVAVGNALVCAGQAWSWAYSSYGNKPIETFPLNRLGSVLGFRITGRNLGHAVGWKSKIEVEGVDGTGWAGSEIVVRAAKAESLLWDDGDRTMAALLSYKKGSVIVAGHEMMFEKNPVLFEEFLKLLREPD